MNNYFVFTICILLSIIPSILTAQTKGTLIPLTAGVNLPERIDQSIALEKKRINEFLSHYSLLTASAKINNIKTSDPSGTVYSDIEVLNFTPDMQLTISGDCLQDPTQPIILNNTDTVAYPDLQKNQFCEATLTVSTPIPSSNPTPEIVIYNSDSTGSFHFNPLYTQRNQINPNANSDDNCQWWLWMIAVLLEPSKTAEIAIIFHCSI